jgi:carboxypeptidase D
MFFWHYQNKHIANKQRTVIWLNGGPGCSSEDGALMEIGPYRVKDASGPILEHNPGSWNEFANIMFVDNPVGTGYSFVDGDSYVKELPEMAQQFVLFLEKWFTMFPEYEHDDVSIISSLRNYRSDICSFTSPVNLSQVNISLILQKRFSIETKQVQNTNGN